MSNGVKGVSKAIPVIGAVVSGGLTLATYRPMAKAGICRPVGLLVTPSR
ncbi:hypothetical protein [Streptomyces sp. KMM 9044]|nr:hypothetical protein [Streptomyces sp. KMM 9044]WAX82158.1 hypothetical protein HUV60_003280 [Streptomyces sp. KMM 9044]